MSNPNQSTRFNWQNQVLRRSIFPFRMKKLREFLLFYWEVQNLEEMRNTSVEDRKKILSGYADKIEAQRKEWQERFDLAFTELAANDKYFAMKSKEKFQLWYLQDQIRYTKNANWGRMRRLLDLFEQREKLPAAVNLDQDPEPDDLTLAGLAVEEERLEKLTHDELLKVILEMFDSDPDTYPQWLQYMIVHFSGMRYKSAHGSWADPTYLLGLIAQNKNIAIPDVPAPGALPFPADQTALEKLKLLNPKIPRWMWKKIVYYTPLHVEEVTENDTDWEARNGNRNEPGFDNAFWGKTLKEWTGKDITQWRAHHQETLDPVVTRAVCNEISEHILHMRWLTPPGGLNNKVDWYRHRARETEDLPANHPHKAIFKRATSVADFKPGASIFWLVWYPQPPNSANVAYAIPGFDFLPDGVKMNGGSSKKKSKGKGGRVDANGWKYGYSGNRMVRTRKLNDQEIQVQLNAKEREMKLQRTRDINQVKKLLRKANLEKNKREIRRQDRQLKQLENDTKFKTKVNNEWRKLRRTVSRQEITQTLRWRHEAIVVSVEDMTSGPYVWTFETETEIGLNKRYLYHLLGTDNNDDYQVFVGYMPSLDNLPENMDPDKFLRGTFMTREHADKMKLRLKEMLRRDWILPEQYPARTYSKPPTRKPQTKYNPADLISDLPPSEQPHWVQVTRPGKRGFITNGFYKERNNNGYPIMIPVPRRKRQKIANGTLVGVSANHKESPTDPGDGTIQGDGRNYFYLVTVCEDYPDAVGTFIYVGHTADVADPVAFKKKQKKIKPTKPTKKIDLLVEATVDPDDETKDVINCWERKKAKTSSGFPAFKLPTDMNSRVQLQTGWNITVHSVLTGENGYFHEIAKCDPLPKAVGLYVREQDVTLPDEVEELEEIDLID